jgi:hypothetical protein
MFPTCVRQHFEQDNVRGIFTMEKEMDGKHPLQFDRIDDVEL